MQADAAGSFRARANHHSPQAAMPSGNVGDLPSQRSIETLPGAQRRKFV